jgi:mannitol-specific phosphotransferase system IIBC component
LSLTCFQNKTAQAPVLASVAVCRQPNISLSATALRIAHIDYKDKDKRNMKTRERKKQREEMKSREKKQQKKYNNEKRNKGRRNKIKTGNKERRNEKKI